MYPSRNFTIDELKTISQSSHKSLGVPFLYKYFTSKYCEIIQSRLPKYVKPNTVTWLGLIPMLICFTSTILFDLKLENPPRALSLFNAISIVFYITTDSLDGIHARKTDQCSSLGKVLDHFIDSIVAFISVLTLCSSLRSGYSVLFINTLVCTMFGFFVAEISERFTGILRFGSISAASEGLYMMAAIHILGFAYPEGIKMYFSNPTIVNQIDKISYTVTIGYILYSLLDLFIFIRRNSTNPPYKQIYQSITRASVILTLFVLPFIQKLSDSYFLVAFLIMLPQLYSINYLEEYICTISGCFPDKKVFLFSCFIFILQLLNYTLLRSIVLSVVLLTVSSVHFLGRTGSIFNSLSRNFNVKIFM